ncbi:MAG: gamma-glutamylcyclotransferase family protein [Verrucomicrobiia bacterium]
MDLSESTRNALLTACSDWPPGTLDEKRLRDFLVLWRECEAMDPRKHLWANPYLSVYGTLAPGEANERWLASLDGMWHTAYLPGRVDRSGPYPMFYPGSGWEPARLFTSPDLTHKYPDLDRFEGPEYRRILWPVWVEPEGWLIANVYAAWDSPLLIKVSIP